jgi:uroporphyrinogen decarboxylase
VLLKICNALIDYLNSQIEAGADTVMIFDSWGGVLASPAYQAFSLQPMQTVLAGVKAKHPDTPVTLFTKGGGQWLEQIATSGCDMVGLDWQTDIHQARKQVGDRVALQGNMDPTLLYAQPEVIRGEVGRILEGFGHGSGHVFNLGHGITPGVNPEHVSAMIEAVQQLSLQYHG